MRNANELEKISKFSAPLPPSPVVPVVKVKKEPPPAVVITALNSFTEEERSFRCEHEGCFSSFKTRSSLRDHQKGNKNFNVH